MKAIPFLLFVALGVLASCVSAESKKQAYLDVLESATIGEEQEMQKKQEKGVIIVREPHSHGPDRKYGAGDAARLAAFMQLYALGEDVNKLKDEYKLTGMSYAIRLNDRAAVDELIALGDDLQFGAFTEDKHDGDCCCSFNSHPSGYVNEALECGHEELARYLLSRGAAPTGVKWCIQNDNVPMLKALLAAGGSVREDEGMEESGPYANFLRARSAEMLRYLFAETPYAQLDKSERIFLIGLCGNENELARIKKLCLQAGVITAADLAAYARGGIAQLEKRREKDEGLRLNPFSYPHRRNYEDFPLWMPFEDAIRVFRALAGSNVAEQDAAVLMMLRYRKNDNVVQQEYDYFISSLVIIGDTRFAALLAKLTPKQLESVRAIVMLWDDSFPYLRKHYPHTAAKLNLRDE